MSVGILDHEEAIWQTRTEFAVGPLDECARGRWLGKVRASVDHPLHLDVRPRFELEISLARIGGIVLGESAIDISRMCVVTLDQVRVIAVHRSNELGHGQADNGMKLSRKLAGFLRKVEREILQYLSTFCGHEGLGGGRRHGSLSMRKMAGSMAGIVSIESIYWN